MLFLVNDANIGNKNEFLVRLIQLSNISETSRHESVDIAEVIGHSPLHGVPVARSFPSGPSVIPVVLAHPLLDDAAYLAERLTSLDANRNVPQALTVPECEPFLRKGTALSSDVPHVLVLDFSEL